MGYTGYVGCVGCVGLALQLHVPLFRSSCPTRANSEQVSGWSPPALIPCCDTPSTKVCCAHVSKQKHAKKQKITVPYEVSRITLVVGIGGCRVSGMMLPCSAAQQCSDLEGGRKGGPVCTLLYEVAVPSRTACPRCSGGLHLGKRTNQAHPEDLQRIRRRIAVQRSCALPPRPGPASTTGMR